MAEPTSSGKNQGVDIDSVIQQNSRKQKKPQLLGSTWEKINSFNLDSVTSSELNMNMEQIYDRIKEEDDIVVPLQMDQLKEEIRTEKKRKIVNAFNQVMSHNFNKDNIGKQANVLVG